MKNYPLILTLLLVAATAQAQGGPPGLDLLRPVGVPEEVENAPRTDARADEGASLRLAPPRQQGPGSGEPASAPQHEVSMDRSPVPAPAQAPSPAPNSPSVASKMNPYGDPLLAEANALRDQVSSMRGQVGSNAGDQVSAQRGAPSELRVEPNVNQAVSVARGQLNRFVTPFAAPVVRSSGEATSTEADGQVVYVATNSQTPITLFIHDEADPLNAISLTLIPRDVPAASVRIRMDGTETASHTIRPLDWAGAESFELSQNYVATIRELFRSLAQGEVPSGYGIRSIRGSHPLMPGCIQPGLEIVPAQEVTGHSIIVVVSRLTNRTGRTIEFDERQCASDSVLAVAAWPHVELRPGASTELYIAVRRPTAGPANARPSVLGAL
jgi:conjugal transfer pilus assembly protein TraK